MRKMFILLFATLQFQLIFAQVPGNKVSQQISLKAGWNIISFWVAPDSTDLRAVFQPLIDESSLIKVQDENGNSLEDLGLFGGWVSYIGTLSLTEGYKVKVSRDCQLSVYGSASALPFDIPLRKGWSLIGFPRSLDVDGIAIVQKLIDSKTLIKIQDETGNSIEDMGILGGWTNNIGKMKPGEGYKIKTNAECVLSILDKYNTYAVSIYGSDDCGYTTSLRNACTSAGIEFQYFNYYSNSQIRDEFWKIVKEFSLGSAGYVNFPVVLVVTVNGRYGLQRPDVNTIKALIGY